MFKSSESEDHYLSHILPHTTPLLKSCLDLYQGKRPALPPPPKEEGENAAEEESPTDDECVSFLAQISNLKFKHT